MLLLIDKNYYVRIGKKICHSDFYKIWKYNNKEEEENQKEIIENREYKKI